MTRYETIGEMTISISLELRIEQFSILINARVHI